MMVERKLLKVVTFAAIGWFALPFVANTQSVENEPVDNDFRSDFLMFEEVDELTTGAVRKREEVFKYCLNVSDQAVEARSAILEKRLRDVEAEVDEKLTELAEQIDVLKTWTQKREDFLAKSNDSLVQIFQNMRPDAAAQQLTEMGAGVASSVVAKLEPKYSSAILAEMKPDEAAKITLILSQAMVTDEQ